MPATLFTGALLKKQKFSLSDAASRAEDWEQSKREVRLCLIKGAQPEICCILARNREPGNPIQSRFIVANATAAQ
jgi:hypothetical protein